jgi:hypothetical protein
MVSLRAPRASGIPTYRTASIAAGALASIVLALWLLLTWDAHLTNFQVRWMCDEDRAFMLLRRDGVEALALPAESLGRDPRVMPAYAEAYPLVASALSAEGRRSRYALVENWPKRVRSYWGYAVLKTDLSIVDREERNRVLGTSGLFRRVAVEGASWPELRARLSPPPEACTPADRVEFVRRVLRPPA